MPAEPRLRAKELSINQCPSRFLHPRFSRLRRNSKFFEELAARCFWDCLTAIERHLVYSKFQVSVGCSASFKSVQICSFWHPLLDRAFPLIAILENVYGLIKFWDFAATLGDLTACNLHSFKWTLQVWREMARLRQHYYVSYVRIDPMKLGCPVHRRRVYIIMVRKPLFTNSKWDQVFLHGSPCVALWQKHIVRQCQTELRDVAHAAIRSQDSFKAECDEIIAELLKQYPRQPYLSMTLSEIRISL